MDLHALPRMPAAALQTLSTRREEACFALLAFAGGIAGGYGSVGCGHVFANALTGNLVSMAAELCAGGWGGVLARLGGVALFVLGIALTVVLPARLCGGGAARWRRLCLLAEAVCFAVQALLPAEPLAAVSYALYLWPVFFAAALQYNTFTALHGVPVSTLFCTNNIRQMTLHALIWRRARRARTPEAAAEAKRERRVALTYLLVSLLFFAGVLFSVATLPRLGSRQMFVCAGLLLALFVWQTLDRPAP